MKFFKQCLHHSLMLLAVCLAGCATKSGQDKTGAGPVSAAPPTKPSAVPAPSPSVDNINLHTTPSAINWDD